MYVHTRGGGRTLQGPRPGGSCTMGGLQDRRFSQDPGMPANGLGPSFPESERTKEATPSEYSPGGQFMPFRPRNRAARWC